MFTRMNSHLTVDAILQSGLTRVGCCCCLCFVASFLLFELPVGRGFWNYVCKELEVVDASNRGGLGRSAIQRCV